MTMDEEIGDDSEINKLPKEVLQYIFSNVLPYQDLSACRLVCKKWYKYVEDLKYRLQNGFTHALLSNRLEWESYQPETRIIGISSRYSHCATRYGDFMYVFGGFTSNCTSFNDLWKLNLSTRKWVRVMPEGRYPPPKGSATIVTYKDNLILFGGRRSPINHLPHVHNNCYDLHMYNIKCNKWEITDSSSKSPCLAGHSATIHGDKMVVFGGLCNFSSCRNDLWIFDIKIKAWYYGSASHLRPPCRYNHAQVALDDKNLLIMGGCSSTPFEILQDVWLLHMGEQWMWTNIDIGNNNLLSNIWLHPVCKIENYIIGFTNNMRNKAQTKYISWFPWLDGRDENPDNIIMNFRRNDDYALNFGRLLDVETSEYRPSLDMYIMDVSELLISEGYPIKWYHGSLQPVNQFPEDTILYTIVPGNAELIIFGGMQKKDKNVLLNLGKVVNFVHFMKSKKTII